MYLPRGKTAWPLTRLVSGSLPFRQHTIAWILNDCDSCLCYSSLGFSPGTCHPLPFLAPVLSSTLVASDAICIRGWLTGLYLSLTPPPELHSKIFPFGCHKLNVSDTELLVSYSPPSMLTSPACLSLDFPNCSWQKLAKKHDSTSSHQISSSLSLSTLQPEWSFKTWTRRYHSSA